MKVFDLRMGAKCYSYCSASERKSAWGDEERRDDWNLFLKPHSATYPGRGGGNNWARRSAESSIYSLASPSTANPYLYAGVENAVLELAFTSILDRDPDVVFFGSQHHKSRIGDKVNGFRPKEVLDLAMYDQTAEGGNLV